MEGLQEAANGVGQAIKKGIGKAGEATSGQVFCTSSTASVRACRGPVILWNKTRRACYRTGDVFCSPRSDHAAVIAEAMWPMCPQEQSQPWAHAMPV